MAASKPVERTLTRSAETGRILSAEEIKTVPKKEQVTEKIKPSYEATVVNATARASGCRVILDIDLPPAQVDVLTAEDVKVKLNVSV